MPSLTQLWDAVETGLAADPRLVAMKAHVFQHGGEFKLEDVKAYARKAPAVMIGVLDITVGETGVAQEAKAGFGVVCLDIAMKGANQHTRCLNLADATLRALRGKFWTSSLNMSAPQQLKARNMFSAKFTEQGIAMWMIAFDQRVDLAEDEDTTVALTRWHTEYDLLPELDEDRPHPIDRGGDWEGHEEDE